MMRRAVVFVAGLCPGWVTVTVSFDRFALPAAIRRSPALVGFRMRASLFLWNVDAKRAMTPLPCAGRSSTATLPQAPLQTSFPIASLPCSKRAAFASLNVTFEAGSLETTVFEGAGDPRPLGSNRSSHHHHSTPGESREGSSAAASSRVLARFRS